MNTRTPEIKFPISLDANGQTEADEEHRRNHAVRPGGGSLDELVMNVRVPWPVGEATPTRMQNENSPPSHHGPGLAAPASFE